MRTEMQPDLIDRLAADLRPTPHLLVVGRLALGLGLGAACSALLLAVGFGWRRDMMVASHQLMFWIKLAYVLLLSALALWACERLARPGGGARRRAPWLIGPPAALLVVAGWQWMRAAPAERMPMLMGHSAMVCPWLIFAASIPPLAGLTWAARGLAPTRLRLTGAMLGLAAGGAGATAYALCCNEEAAPFLVAWYSLGVVLAGGAGWLLGPRTLRW